MRIVTLRDEKVGSDRRHVEAYLDETGNLRIDGQDLGPRRACARGSPPMTAFAVE